jgi:phosphoglycerate kinase
MKKLGIQDLDLKGKRALVRVDFNVPLDESGRITDDTRIRAALPTIRRIMEEGGKAILVSHLGRPKGKPDPAFSLAPAARRLSELLGRKVTFVDDCVGGKVRSAVEKMEEGDVILLENLRFHPGEKAGDDAFAEQLAEPADLYIDDAFGTAHRGHASMVGVAAHLQPAAAGFLLQKEIEYLGAVLSDPRRPLVAILGGAKVSDKITVIESLIEKVDSLLIGGAMAYTFLQADGVPVGASKVEEEVEGEGGETIKLTDLVRDILRRAEQRGVEVLLPVDHLAADRFAADAAVEIVPRDGIKAGWLGMDIGPETARIYGEKIREAGTVFWNGPMGVFEMKPFAAGTMAIARALADSSAVSIVGGGDSVSAVNLSGVADRITHVSTGGGASLEFLEGKTLPGLAALTDSNQ